MLIDNGGGSFMISGILSGNVLNFSLNNMLMGCIILVNVFVLDCSCEFVVVLISGGNVVICDGDFIFVIIVIVFIGIIIDWYDSVFGGIFLVDNIDSFMFFIVGIYFVEVRVIVNGCLSVEWMVIIIIVNLIFVLFNSEVNCVLDLLIYIVILSFSDVVSISVSNGVVSNDGVGIFMVSGIFVGENLSYIVFNVGMSCFIGLFNLDVFDCFCFVIIVFISNGDVSICVGDVILNLSVILLLG